MQTEQFYKELIKRYKNKTASDDELEVLFHLLREGKIDRTLIDDMEASEEEEECPKQKQTHFSLWATVAAVLLAVCAVSVYLFVKPNSDEAEYIAGTELINDVEAGGNRATLTLSDGRKIILDSLSIGASVQENGLKISKTEDGMLVYEIADKTDGVGRSSGDAEVFNEMNTPLGGQYQVILPDGSKVWLNAASSLRYPTVFAKDKREVHLAGEAYFEVKQGQQPFMVLSATQAIRVLGTQFNLKTYGDEQKTTTTLLSGSVELNLHEHDVKKVLKPGEQARYQTGQQHLSVATVDVSEAVAWKNGFFAFNNTDLNEVMREVARWYDVEVDVDNMPNRKLYASLPKHVKLSELLEMIDMTSNVKFKIEGRRVYL